MVMNSLLLSQQFSKQELKPFIRKRENCFPFQNRNGFSGYHMKPYLNGPEARRGVTHALKALVSHT
jgi:hypothetical protein